MRSRVVVTMTVELEWLLDNRDPTREEIAAAVRQLTEAALHDTRAATYADNFRMGEATFSDMTLRP